MSDEQKPLVGAEKEEEAVKPDELESISPAELARMVRELRKEAAEHRVKANDARAKLSEQEKAREAALEAQRKEQGDFKSLYGEALKKLEALTKERETIAGELTALRLGQARAKIAAEVGLPAALAARLSGETDEEIRADAEALKTALGSGAPASGANAGRAPQTTTAVPGGQTGTSITDWLKRTPQTESGVKVVDLGGGNYTYGG